MLETTGERPSTPKSSLKRIDMSFDDFTGIIEPYVAVESGLPLSSKGI